MTVITQVPQPIPIKDGDWWICARLMRFDCPRCKQRMYDRPAVKGYVPALDPLGAERRGGRWLWPRCGWLLWFSCDRCRWDSMAQPENMQRLGFDALIVEWSRRAGPWVRWSDDRGPSADKAHDRFGRNRIPDSLRGLIYARDGYRCRECGTAEDLAIDHIYPVSKGGSNDLANLQTLCGTCNSHKGAKVLTDQPCRECGRLTGSPTRSRCSPCALREERRDAHA